MTERRRDLSSDLEELFDELWQMPRFAGIRRAFRPHVDSFLSDDPPELTIVADLAGVDPASISVVAGERALTISGERVRSCAERADRVSYQQMEIPFGPFERRVNLPAGVDADGARAGYERGLLTVVLPLTPKPAPPGPVSIEVRRA